ncbi:MAG: N-acetylmuramoyl-L-alanine amidase [Euryarchaeota archaeon]|nr:N-acetylmuramoyl-L-alanine amidase [Euryarchaeota archaeon]
MNKKIICLSAGHGGNDPGACGNGLKEADLTGDIVERIKPRLKNYNCDVVVAPRYEDLGARTTFANQIKASLYLSIHCNGGGGTGFESFIHTNTGEKTKEIQATIHNAAMAYLKKHEIADRGLKTANFQVLRETSMPAVLLECLFVDHPEDAKLLASEVFRDGLANEIAYGVAQAMNLQTKKNPENSCQGCQIVQELSVENSNLRSQVQSLKQTIKEIQLLVGGLKC